jgi:hypothetical protein
VVADLPGKGLTGFAVARLLALQQQVADVHQLQYPARRRRLHPAAQMQGLVTEPGEIQVEHLPLPVLRPAFDRQRTVCE